MTLNRRNKFTPAELHGEQLDIAVCKEVVCLEDCGNSPQQLYEVGARCPSWTGRIVQPAELNAVQFIKGMPGTCQSKLILGNDGNLWVVKFQNNPEHVRVLANEMIGTRIAEALGLSVSPCRAINVSSQLIERSPDLVMRSSRPPEKCVPGPQFASKFVSGLMPGQVLHCPPPSFFLEQPSRYDIAGMLAFDKWTGNCDMRQAVYRRTAVQKRYQTVFIDQSHCFNAGKWTFPDTLFAGTTGRADAYWGVTGWDAFEPWLTRIEEFAPEELWTIALAVPAEWYENDIFRLEQLISALLRRRGRVRDLIDQFRKSDRHPFPLWRTRSYGLPLLPPLKPCLLPPIRACDAGAVATDSHHQCDSTKGWRRGILKTQPQLFVPFRVNSYGKSVQTLEMMRRRGGE